MSRNIQDYLLTKTKALPAQNTNNSSDSIDLEQVTLDSVNEVLDALLTVPATPSLANSQTITYTFQDSADNSSFAAIPELATAVSTGGGGVGAAAVSRRVKLPPTTRRYLRVNAAVSATGGDNTAISYTLKVLA